MSNDRELRLRAEIERLRLEYQRCLDQCMQCARKRQRDAEECLKRLDLFERDIRQSVVR